MSSSPSPSPSPSPGSSPSPSSASPSSSPPSSPLDRETDVASGRPAASRLEDIVSLIRASRSFSLLAHVNPDGDSLGSLAALTLTLRALGKHARAWTAGPVPERFAGLFPDGALECLPAGSSPPVADACFLLDTGEPERAGPYRAFLMEAPHRRICIDHHPDPNVPGFDAALVVPRSPSTGSLVLRLIERLEVPLDGEIASALWIALATDTGWFRFANTTPWAFLDGARLVEAGVDTEGIYQKVYADLSPQRARVLGAVLAGTRTDVGGRLAVSLLARQAYEREGLTAADLDGMVDSLKSVRGASVVALVVEVEEGLQKVSLRALGTAEVGSIARKFGGGGHAKAAGFRFRGSAEEAVRAVAAEVRASSPP